MRKFYRVNMFSEYPSLEELAEALREVAGQLERGYTTGYDPTFEIEEYEEDEEEV